MATEVILPKVDMVMETGTFVEWLKREGEWVSKGEPLFIMATDKSAIEVEAPESGILAGLRAQPDEVIPVTTVVAYILSEGEVLPRTAGVAPLAPAQAPESPLPSGDSGAALVSDDGSQRGKPRVTPMARRLAAELGLDLRLITGRGPRGRIHKEDVLAASAAQAQAFAVRADTAPETGITAPAPPVVAAPLAAIRLPNARQKQVIPLAGARKIIAERMAYSASTAPHITLTLSVDMSEAVRLRDLLQPEFGRDGARLSFTAIIARAVAFVLTRHPYMNASLSGDNIVLWEDVHLGIATSLEDNLIVPVIREAQSKSLRELVAAMTDLVDRARTRRLPPGEMSGSTFTISNLGMFAIESFTSIINPPEVAILSVGAIVERQVATRDGVALRPMMSVTACADHRVLDGVMVARFLADLQKTLQNPYLLI